MKYFAVIDTNVLVSAMLKQNTPPDKIIRQTLSGNIIPLLNKEFEAFPKALFYCCSKGNASNYREYRL